MAGPPDDVSAAELYLKLSEPKPSEVFDFPRKDEKGKPVCRVRLQVLSGSQQEEARIFGHKKLKEKYRLKEEDMGGVTMREVAGDAVARELLAIACRFEKPIKNTEEDDTGPSYPRMFRDANHVNELTSNEILVLFNAYLLTQEKYGPFERDFESKEDLDRWVKRIEEGGAEFPLLHLSLPRLVELTSSLAGRISSLYRLIASQWSSLPDSLKLDLRNFSEDISSYGSAPEELDPSGSESSPDDDIPAFKQEQPLTIEEAKELALRLRNPRGSQ
jgi:hypothetical protein